MTQSEIEPARFGFSVQFNKRMSHLLHTWNGSSKTEKIGRTGLVQK